jgi:apyrase
MCQWSSVLFLCYLVCLAAIQQGSHIVVGAGTSSYGVMMDAGSTGTRVMIYTWDTRTSLDFPPRNEFNQIGSTQVKPGLSKFGTNIAGIQSYLMPLISYALEVIPAEAVSTTPIYLKATAGMRALPESQRNNVILRVRKIFKTTPFLFQDDWASIITGQEEGAFAWVAANYLLQRINSTRQSSQYYVGALDLGGMSTQIAFFPSMPPIDSKFDFSLGSHFYPLYSHSYAGYGNDAARIMTNQAILKLNPRKSTLYNPCYLNGYKETFIDSVGVSHSVWGSGDYAQCLNLILTSIIDITDETCEISPCAFNGVYQPSLVGSESSSLDSTVGVAVDFYPTSAYIYAHDFFGLPQYTSIESFVDPVTTFCGTNYSVAYAAADPSVQPFVYSYCFLGTYVIALLQYGYGIPPSTSMNFIGSVDGTALGWSLGAMVVEANLLPYTSKSNCGTSSAMMGLNLSMVKWFAASRLF